MISRKGYGGDANVSVVKRNKNGLNGQKNKGEGREREGRETGKEIFKRRGSSTMWQVALLFVLHTLFLPLKHISRCARSIEKEDGRCSRH